MPISGDERDVQGPGSVRRRSPAAASRPGARTALDAGRREPRASTSQRWVAGGLAVGFIVCAATAWAFVHPGTLLSEAPAQIGGWAASIGAPVEPGVVAQDRETLALRRVAAGVAGLVSLLGLLTLAGLLRQRSRLRRPVDRIHWAVGATRTQFAARALGATWRPALAVGVVSLMVGVAIGPVVESTFPGLARVPETGFLAGALLVALGTVLLHRASRAGLRARRSPGWLSRILSAPAGVGAVGFAVLVTVALTARTEGAAVANADTGSRVAVVALGGVDAEQRAERLEGMVSRAGRGVGFASTGTARGAGSWVPIQVDCGRCSVGGLPLPVQNVRTEVHAVAPDTFGALGVELLRGRDFGLGDRGGTVTAAVVSRSMALRHFEGGEAVGRRLRFRDSDWIEVVGVVADRPGIRDEATEFALYIPLLQARPEVVEVYGDHPEEVLGAAGGASPAPDRLVDLQPLGDVFATRRWFRRVLTLLGVLALGLSLAAIWSAARSETQAEHPETALRRALGASPARLWIHFARFAFRQCATALLVGGWLALALAIELERSLGRLPLLDLRIWAGAAAPVVLVFVAGALPPFRSALRAPPATALGALEP